MLSSSKNHPIKSTASAAAAAAGTASNSSATPSQADKEPNTVRKNADVPNKRNLVETFRQNPSSDPDTNYTFIYQCEVCSQRYRSPTDFARHSCGLEVCEICGVHRKNKQALLLHQQRHEREKLECEINVPCDETKKCGDCDEMVRANAFDVHQKSHTSGLKLYPCRLCSNIYLSMSRLNEHINNCHGDSRAYHCGICNSDFKTLAYLKAHQDIHSERKRYKCGYCDKLYHRKWDRNHHEYIHTGEKPLECAICGRDFRVKYSLQVHMRTHSNERPYQCNTCHKRFKSLGVLSHHIKLHGEERAYKCPQCPKAFKNLVAMIGHKNRHLKPYSCDVCNRRFASKYDVKVHMPIHDAAESRDVYSCKICNAAYARKHVLLEHCKEHEGVEGVSDDTAAEVCETEELVTVLQMVEQEEVVVGEPAGTDEVVQLALYHA